MAVVAPSDGPADPSIVVPADKPPASGWPAKAKFYPANWLSQTQYRTGAGDTFAGLSALYLGSPIRWREIWQVQTPAYTAVNPNPDKLNQGAVITMPKEAGHNAHAMGADKAGMSLGMKIGIGAAAAGAVGGIALLAMHKKPAAV